MLRLAPRSCAAVLGALVSLALAGSAQAEPSANYTCDGIATGTYDNVTVPPNGSCTLTNATVRGNVIVQSGAFLDTQGTGSIHRNLLAADNTDVTVSLDWTVYGSTLANAAFQMTLDGTVHNVLLNNTQDANLYATTIEGSLVSNGAVNSLGIQSTTRITGNVVINNTAAGGSYYLSYNPQIDGSVLVTNNQTAGSIDDNVIARDLACYRNTPPPANFANQVGGRSLGQCSAPTVP